MRSKSQIFEEAHFYPQEGSLCGSKYTHAGGKVDSDGWLTLSPNKTKREDAGVDGFEISSSLV